MGMEESDCDPITNPCPQRDLAGVRCGLYRDHPGSSADGGHVFVVTLSPPTAGVPSLYDIGSELATWWRNTAESEIDKTVAKAVEYSGTGGGLPADLVDYGRQWAFASGLGTDFTDAQYAEIGVWCYLVGKLGRWSSALRNGRMVSDDTLLDIGVYVRIAQRIREKGQWP